MVKKKVSRKRCPKGTRRSSSGTCKKSTKRKPTKKRLISKKAIKEYFSQ